MSSKKKLTPVQQINRDKVQRFFNHLFATGLTKEQIMTLIDEPDPGNFGNYYAGNIPVGAEKLYCWCDKAKVSYKLIHNIP